MKENTHQVLSALTLTLKFTQSNGAPDDSSRMHD